MNSNKLLKFYFLLTLIIPLTFLMWHGESVIKKEAIKGYSVFSFVSPHEDDLTIEIKNLESSTITYTISSSINKKQLRAVQKTVPAGKSLLVTPDQQIIEEFLLGQKNEYLVKISWNKTQKTLARQFSPK